MSKDYCRTFMKLLLMLSLAVGITSLSAAETSLTVDAAASTTGPLMKIAKKFKEKTNITIKTSFASSGVLARQIEQGAPADVYISASKKWADYAEKKGLLKDGTRKNFLKNTLVLIKPKGSNIPINVKFSSDYDFPAMLSGRLSIGNPEHVPAGKYAQQSLTALGWWQKLQNKLILSKDVRSALRVVEAAEAEFGIVYGSDAKKSEQIEIAGIFPPESHKPIVYVIAEVKGGSEESKAFIDYIFSDAAKAIFEEFGFVPAGK